MEYAYNEGRITAHILAEVGNTSLCNRLKRPERHNQLYLVEVNKYRPLCKLCERKVKSGF